MKWTLLWVVYALVAPGAGLAAGNVSSNAPGAVANAGADSDKPQAPGDQYTNSIGMELVKVGGYWVGKYEVSQKEFQKVTGSNPSAFGGPTRPVDSVSWNDAMSFCAKLTAQQIDDKKLPEGFYYTLPTEDEWQQFSAGTSLDDSVTSKNTRRSGTEPVGSLRPNALGLFDTRGNVMEFCLSDPSRPYRVLHGGSWQDSIEVNLRPEFRFSCTPSDRKNTFGFRVVLKKK